MKTRRKTIGTALLVYLILVQFLVLPAPIQVKADGAVSSQEVWVQWRRSTNEGSTGTQGNGSPNRISYSEMNITYQYEEIDADALKVYYLRGYIYSDDGDDRQVLFLAYNWTAEDDPGDLIDYVEQNIDEVNTASYEWRTYTISGGLWINSSIGMVGDDWVFFMGMDLEYVSSEDGQMHFSLGNGGDTSGQSGYFNNPPDSPDAPPSPLVEDNENAWLQPLQIRFWGYRNKTTTYNGYNGTASDFLARRDINYTFPTDVNNKEIRITFPKTEYFRNITASNGGLWDDALASDEYTVSSLNASHYVITIGNTALDDNGADLRLHTQSTPYAYTLYGPFYENGTNAPDMNVTFHYLNSTSEIRELNGTLILGSASQILLLSWDLTGGGTRRYYTPFQSEVVYVFVPEDTYAEYSFTIKDYIGKLGDEGYIETWRSVNGSEVVIERGVIHDPLNPVPMSAVLNTVYHIQLLWQDQSRYDWGYWVADVDPSPTILVRGVVFSDKAQVTYRYVTVQVRRPAGNTITVDYNDTLTQTISVNISVGVREGEYPVFEDSTTDDSHVFTWAAANASIDYVVFVEITHEFFGELSFHEYVDADKSFVAFPDVSALGTFGGIQTGNLMAFAFSLIFYAGGTYEFGSTAGLLMGSAVLSTLTYLGAANFSFNFLAFIWFLTIIMVLRGKS